MRRRPIIWILLCLLCLVGVWLLWHQTANTRTKPSALPKIAASAANPAVTAANLPAAATNGAPSAKTNQFAYRLSNTGKTIGQLVGDRHAILLENALIDSSQPLNFSIPKNLQSPGDPGAYIVQARGPIGNAFRALLAQSGAQIVSYIPNDAYLVRAPAGVASGLMGNHLTQAVIPYEPYYKISSSMPVTAGQKTFSFVPMETNGAAGPSLLVLAVNQAPLPAGTHLTLGLFSDGAAATVAEIEKLGGRIVAQDTSPFGPVVRVRPPADWVALAALPGVQIVEPYHPRMHANDLSRATVGVAADTQVSSNYLGLTGKNVLVQVNDSGIDAGHPDLTGRVIGDPAKLVDYDGHGTHVAGTIAGDGTESTTVTNAQGSIMLGISGQFRGMAPAATLLSMDWNLSDQELQEVAALAALTNALISNNSWNYGSDSAYDLYAASYDAAVRDALPEMTGSQPVLFVFSAGNSGNGDNSGANGNADSILSPATAKNVITVGALEQPRGITNTVVGYHGDTNPEALWESGTDTGSQVANYSSRGNVGVLTEGTYGRFKPDVVAPGSFVVSTRSQQWDELAYYNPTNTSFNELDNEFLFTNAINYYKLAVPINAVGVRIQIVTNKFSPVPFPNLALFVSLNNFPDPANPTTYDFVNTDNEVSIPPDIGGVITDIQALQGLTFNYAVWNTNNFPVYYNVDVFVLTTNDVGDYFQVLSNLNDSVGSGPPYYYRYESGTSMSAADVSGVLALMEDYFTNQLQLTPSPALLKGLLINGARATGNNIFAVTNAINFQGWGLINLPNTLPPGMTNQFNAACASFFIDQSSTNGLATGDSHTYMVAVDTNTDAQLLPLRVTLAWTDPPGDPVAAIKLVNNLDLVVSNTATAEVFFGNQFASSGTPPFSVAWDTNSAPNPDSINNVENVFLPPLLAGNYAVTVVGRNVNVNAVTAQTNNAAGVFAPNVVQDYALVISCGEGEVTNAFTVTDNPIVSNPTNAQQITFVSTTNQPLLNQMVGASPPLLGTNNLPVGTNTIWGSNSVVTLGLVNQWHFYVVTNNALDSSGSSGDVTNAAFITFSAATLAIPRVGVFADSAADATRPEADIDLYVAGPNDPNASGLTNLDPTVISNCLAGANGDAASLSRGGTEYVVYTNSAPGAVYYIGIYSEDQEASEYDFIPIFTSIPFSQMNPNGTELVNGLNVPINIPDATSQAHAGVAYVFAIALFPMEMNRVVVTNTIAHQNFGDLIGALAHGDSAGTSQSIILNNHDTYDNASGIYTNIYDDSGWGDIVGSKPTDGPGHLSTFVGQQAIGPWILAEVDTTPKDIGTVNAFNLLIEPHRDLKQLGVEVTVPAGSWFIDYIDVPAGFTNLSIFATNLPPTSAQPLQLYLNYDVQPDFTNYLEFVLLTNGVPPGNSISYGPPLEAGRYFVGLFNPDTVSHDVDLLAVLGGAASVIVPGDYTTNSQPPLLDDAVTNSTIFVSSTQQIASVNVGFVVEHPRISDLTFTLVSPAGQRILLMENRGGTTTNGAGDVFVTTNNFGPVTSAGDWQANTNYINVGQTYGKLTVTYDFYTVPDEMTVYYGTTITPPNQIYDTGMTNGTGQFTVSFGPGTSTYVTVIMNLNGNTNLTTAWTYTAGGVETNYNYLAFTEDTNLATIPIKFAIPPYTLNDFGTNYTLSDFEQATNGDYFAVTNIFDDRGGWNLVSNQVIMLGTNRVVLSNQVSVITDPDNAATGSNFLALASGTISRPVPMTPGRQFSLTYLYRGPGIAGWWRGEGNATDSSDPENYGNNGSLIGRFNFPAGEVGQAFEFEDAGSVFEFAGTNTYVQIRQTPYLIQINTNSDPEFTNLVTVQTSALDVGTGSGFTVEGWINPTNAALPQPLVEWLARVPTNGSDTNLVIAAGPFLDRDTGHYYYLLGSTNWTTSEIWATQLGGHLATIETANEENWVYDTFADYGGTNRNLWIGLTNNPSNPTNFGWSSGLTNAIYYTNWTATEPTNLCGDDNYTAILGQTNAFPGLWVLEDNSGNDNNGVTCGVPPSNHIYGVVEVEEIQTNGVQLWISITNSPGMTNLLVSSNGCLYANLIDITNGWHEIFSAPGLIQSNVYQHVALTYNTNTGVAALYYNGTNVAATNLGVFVPKTTGDVLLGRDMSRLTNNFYGGKMDEMSIYRRCLSASEIAAIYNLSAYTTNRNTGKFDPSITPGLSLAEARVSLGGLTNIILGANTNWQMQSLSFVATTSSLPLQISGLEPGMLLDSFSVAEAPLGNLYYLPEQSLDSLIGTSAYGAWTLEIWDNRAGAVATNLLVSWQLQIVLQTNALPAVALGPDAATTITVPPGDIVYLTVAVPPWATSATNILVSATGPVDLLFNQTNPPSGVTPPDYPLLLNASGPNAIGLPVLNMIGSTPPLLPGQTYYLGVRNSGAHAVTAVVEVDYNMTTLSNGVPVTDMLTTNATDVERYYAFDVTSNAYEATFQLLQLSGNADLVVRKGAPLPTLTSSDYGSFNTANADENIYVFTNSSPVPLSAGRWYLGVFPRDARPIQYAILAKELDLTNNTSPAIILLTNNVPVSFTAGPGAALTNFFLFTVTNFPPAIRFELYNASGNGDLTVQTNAPPFGPPFFQTSQQPGRSPELIFLATNSALSSVVTNGVLTNSPLANSVLTNLNAQWYLGVPNRETNLITYMIVAVLETNGYLPSFPGAAGAGGGAEGGGSLRNGTNGTVYHVFNLADSGPGTLRDAVSTTNRTIVFDVSGIIKLLSPLVITNSYLTIAGQTAPGSGITVAGQMTTVQFAHDVIIRDLRFRPSGAVIKPVVAWFNGFEGGNISYIPTAGTYFAGGWYVNSGSVDLLVAPIYGSTAYEGTNYIVINGNGPGTISTNVTTVPGMTYLLSFAYSRNPDGGSPDVVQLLVNSNSLLTLSVTTNNSWANLGWATTSVVFTAKAPTTQIQFASQTAGLYGVLLDAISLSTNVPASTSPGDSLQFTNVMDVIADHVSTAWSTNTLVSVLDSTNVTVQWSILADSLHSTNGQDGYGSWLRYGAGALSFNHNLYANNYSANPRLGDNLSLDFVNNVIYNWGIFPGYSTNDMADNPLGFTNQLNYACNYLIAGPDSVVTNFAITGTNLVMTNIAFWGGSTNTWIYQSNNIIDSDTNRALNGADTEWGMFTNLYTQFGRPFQLPPVPTDEAFIAYEKVLDFAGVSLFARDWVDAEIVTGVRTQTGRIISTPPLGLIGWWPGDGNANDIVGGNNGVAVNVTYTNGVVRQAFAFNPNNYPPGTYTGVQIPDQPAYVLTNSLSIEGWIRPAATQLQMVFWRGDQRGGFDPYFLQMNADGTIQFAIDDPANNQVLVKTPIANNQWTHVAGTLDGNTGTMSIYTNGVLAAQTITSFRPLGPLDPTQDPAIGIGNLGSTGFSLPFNGDIDEISLYGRALSAVEIKYIYNAGSAGKYVSSPPPPLDSDQDGIPDYWEITLGTDPFVASNNNDRDGDGYTDLEEYINWLAAPHALTVTNTPVGVDLMRLFGKTGNLSFSATNGIHGFVYLTNVLGSVTNIGQFSNSFAIFTPTNNALATTNYSGYASFDVYVTNNDTIAWFGPVTVSVMVSVEPVIYSSIITLTNLVPYTAPQSTGTNGVDYYRYDVSTNATGVKFEVLNPTGDVTLLARYGLPLPRMGSYDYISANPGTNNELILVWTNSLPVPLTNGWWYLAVSNASGGLVNYTMLVTEITNTAPTPPTLPSLPDLTILGGTTVIVTNTATDTNAGAVLVYTLVNPPAWASGNMVGTNFVITLSPAMSDAPTSAVITTIVTDTFTALSASNSFIAVVVTTNGLPAFPGAEGAGGLALGGRGGDVYHVVNLNDSGPGSLRGGVQTTAGSRTIVFDVSGTINLLSSLKINKPYLTIAGQTAPGDGIAIKGWLTSVQKTHDVQVRFLRCRPGDINCPTFQDDSFHFDYAMNSIADHVSASWSIDEALSTTDSTNITVQWSMIAEPLNDSCHVKGTHGYGSLIRYGYGAVSYHHNLYADCYSRNPRPGDNIQLDFINNVVFNWGIFAGYNEDDSTDNPGGYTNFLNSIGNYLIAGTNTTANPNIAFQSGVPDPTFTQIYQSGNFIDNNPYGALNGTDTGWGMFIGPITQLASPISVYLGFPGVLITTNNSASEAYEQVLDFAGASIAGASSSGLALARDTVDTNIVTGVRYKNGFIIDTEAQVGGWPLLSSAPLPVDTDGDGMPDYWEITLGMNPLVPNNNHPNPDGYTDLEHYLNWLAAPHALTVTNTPVAVDLYAIAGRSGNLGFSVANGTNGTVTLTNTIATFTPANNYFGFASFSFTITNLDTAVGFGPVTVSVMVSATNIVTTGGIIIITNGVPVTNSLPAGGLTYYAVTVPTNADFATNLLLFATAPVNVWFDTNFPPTTNRLLLPDVAYPGGTNGSAVLSTNTAPPLVPGSTYYLGVQNTNSFTVTFALEVDFHLQSGTNAVSGPISISSITATNIGGKFGFLLTWYAPTNDSFMVQWTGSLAPVVWNTFTNVITYTGPVTPTNGLFTFFDDGSQTAGFGPERFYRLLLLGSGPGLTNGVPQTNSVSAGNTTFLLINVPANATSASNLLISATGPVNVWFNQTHPPTDNTNAGDFLELSATNTGSFLLTSNSVPPLVPGASYYLGVQNPGTNNVTFVFQVTFGFAPTNAVSLSISSITATNIGGKFGLLLAWYAPTNDSFMVQWTASLAPVVWNTFTNVITYTGPVTPTNGLFTFFDDGSQTAGFGPERFYRLLLLGSGPGLTNGVPQTNSVSAGNTAFLLINVPANATSASNLLVSATGPVNVWFNQTHPPTDNTNAGDFLELSATNTGSFLLTSNSVPPLVPGANYYLGVQNPGTNNVTFVFQVAFDFAPTNAVSHFSITTTNTGIWLKWNGLTNYQYQVQWTTNLAPPTAWNTISNIILTSTTGIFTFFDDGSLTGGFGPLKFYRLIVWPFMTPIPQTLSISSVTVTNIAGTNDLVLRWSAPTNYQYGIQWTTNLTLPLSNWTVIPSPALTLTNGVYTFIDNGQTGLPASAKFFRLLEY